MQLAERIWKEEPATGSRRASHPCESGARPLSALPRTARPEHFEEPDAELISIVERAAETPSASPPFSTEASAYLTLEQQIIQLQRELHQARAELRERDAELEELKGLLFPAAPRPLHSAPAQLTPTHAPARPAPLPSVAPARPLSLRAPAARVSILSVGLRVLLDGAQAGHFERSAPQLMLEFTDPCELYSDLSGELEKGGVFIPTYQCLAVDTPVELVIQLSDGSALSVQGRVGWLRRDLPGETLPGMGIQFACCSTEALGTLRACYSLLPPRYFEA